jgi:signal peptidase
MMDITYKQVALVGLIVVIAPFLVFSFPQVVGANQSYVVLSSSMSPAIQAGDIVFITDVEPAAIEEGDVITFESNGVVADEGDRVTHRVVDIKQQDGGLYFRTKGDANDSPDNRRVPAEDVLGHVSFHVPMIGHIIAFAGTTMGTIATVVVPAILLIVLEVRDLWRGATEEE